MTSNFLSSAIASPLAGLYLKLTTSMVCGWILGRTTAPAVSTFLGRFLFWLGVPVSIVAFLRQADLSGGVWLAAAIAWLAIAIGGGVAGLGWQQRRKWTPEASDSRAFQGSLLLAAMFGNTGYMGYPIILDLVGERYFAWAVFYDLAGTVVGAYGLGVLLGAYLGGQSAPNLPQLARSLWLNPVWWAFCLGLALRPVEFASWAESGLEKFAWTAIFLALVLIGMRLSQLRRWRQWRAALLCLSVKMLLVPMLLGLGLSALSMAREPRLVLILQSAMPPAFATLVIAEAYDLDRELSVTTVAIGSFGLLFTLPLWLFLFS